MDPHQIDDEAAAGRRHGSRQIGGDPWRRAAIHGEAAMIHVSFPFISDGGYRRGRRKALRAVIGRRRMETLHSFPWSSMAALIGDDGSGGSIAKLKLISIIVFNGCHLIVEKHSHHCHGQQGNPSPAASTTAASPHPTATIRTPAIQTHLHKFVARDPFASARHDHNIND
ncbi:hypothetical protein ACLOJK_022439 [Asimina triloba]